MDQYESWLAKQQAMGRPIPVTTAPYYAEKPHSTVASEENEEIGG